MLKGKTQIILTDVNTGKQEVYEDKNLVTNALDKIINIEMAMNHPLDSYMLPIATRALGGLMLFDGTLTEDPANIHFPAEAHLVGYAGQDVNTNDKFRGSYNAIESGRTDEGYVSVWDFGTGQANGTIKAVARTSYHIGANPFYYYIEAGVRTMNIGAPTTDQNWMPIRYDGEYLYMLKENSSTHIMRLARVKIPLLKLGVADYSDLVRNYEIVATWNTHLTSYTYYNNQQHTYTYTQEVYADNQLMYEDGHDGYIYCIAYAGSRTYREGDYDLEYFTIKYSDGSYEKSETQRVNIGLPFYSESDISGKYWARRTWGHVHEGILYQLASDRKRIYKIPLNLPTSFSTTRIIETDSNDYIRIFDAIAPRNGGVYFEVYHYTSTGYNYRNGILYPDGYFVLPEVSIGGTYANHGNSNDYMDARTCDDDLTMWGDYRYSTDIYANIGHMANYLGTINNLASAITKTAAQTMKIVYTLTDEEE